MMIKQARSEDGQFDAPVRIPVQRQRPKTCDVALPLLSSWSAPTGLAANMRRKRAEPAAASHFTGDQRLSAANAAA